MSRRPGRVKNKSAAPTQITAEQIMREAQQYRDPEMRVPKQRIVDADELQQFRLTKRKYFEDLLRLNRANIDTYCRYALWEDSQGELDRSRSVFERAIDQDYRSQMVWLKYAEMEMKNKNINHARNVWERATTLLPRVDQFWFKYIHMEEMLGDVFQAREIFNRWMEYEPADHAWQAFVKFELRFNEVDNARAVMQRFVRVRNTVSSWLRYAKFEEKLHEVGRARFVYEQAMDELGDDANTAEMFLAFGKFEERAKEPSRVRAVYRFALDNLPAGECDGVRRAYEEFEKRSGSKAGVEDIVVRNARIEYEAELEKNPRNYDVWFDYVRLEEGLGIGGATHTREVYSRAVQQTPPFAEKRYWRRYIFLWMFWALWEEMEAHDIARAREVYEKALRIIPHSKFSFAKLWILFAHFELRQKNIERTRKILGQAIGRTSGAPKIFREYITLEMQLGEFERCRTLYVAFLQRWPSMVSAWVDFAKLEASLGEDERCRAIFELGIGQAVLDLPELLWKQYIDVEIELQNFEWVIGLYERLLEKTTHVKVFVSYAQFLCGLEGGPSRARSVFERASKLFKEDARKEDRAVLVESWLQFEMQFGDGESRAAVEAIQPMRTRKRRALRNEDGTDAGWEEYTEFEFPDDDVRPQRSSLAFLEAAKRWRKENS